MSDELLPETRRALLHRLATAQVEGRAPSVVAAVVRDGRTVWQDGWGDVDGERPDGDVQYRIGSITKTFVAIEVLRLRDEGVLALTDPIGRHLPGAPAGDATIGDLLAHTSGLHSEPPGPWFERTPGSLRPELGDLLADPPRAHPVGERFHYSNPGYALLGALVEQLRGRTWDEVLRAEVLEPLGLTRTTPQPVAPHAPGWAVHPWADVVLPEPLTDLGRMGPAGQAWSTTTDLARLAVFLLDGDSGVLGPESLARMRTPSAAPEAGDWDSAYGMGLQIVRRDGRLLAGHTGSVPGFVATVWTSATDGLGAVVLANVTSGFPVARLAADLLHTVAEREPRIPAPWRPLTSIDPDLLALSGPWYWGAAPFALRPLADGALELRPLAGAARGGRLVPVGDREWRATSGYFDGERLRIVRDASGAVTHLDLGTFVFTRRPYEPEAVVPGGLEDGGWQTALS
jgi:CubicO group peptidase (beta-lactamase class C family)